MTATTSSDFDEAHESSITPHVLTKSTSLPPDFFLTIYKRPISENHTYGQYRNRRFMYKAGKEYKQYVSEIAQDSHQDKLDGKLVAEVIYYFPDKRKRDAMNYHKPLMDSLQDIAYDNDTQITDITFRKRIDKDNPRTELKLWRLDNASNRTQA